MHKLTKEVDRIRARASARGITAAAVLVFLPMAAGCISASDNGPTVASGTAGPITITTQTPGPAGPTGQSNPAATTAPPSSPPSTRPGTTDRICGDTSRWGTSQQEQPGSPVSAEIFGLEAGRHATCDRVRFDISTPGPVGWKVAYVPQLLSDPQEAPIPVAGNAILRVTIQAPDFGSATTGHQPGSTRWRVGQAILHRDGWPAVIDVTFAGSFENVSGFGIGIAGHRRPFHVWTQVSGGSVRQIVVDIAH